MSSFSPFASHSDVAYDIWINSKSLIYESILDLILPGGIPESAVVENLKHEH